MADTLLLEVVAPERSLVQEQVREVQVPALNGYIGVLPGHAPLLSELQPGGVLRYNVGGQDTTLAVYGGFVEVLPDRVRVLADAAERREEINLEEARRKLREALEKLGEMHGEAIDPAVALAEALRAQARVEAAED
jgi:F-type H+-transporting ATPase subunit epsilon